MSDFVVNARSREDTGTSASRRMRHAKQIPAVVYGVGKENRLLVLDHDEFKHQLDIEAFHNSILKLNTGQGSEQVILREVQMHPHKPLVTHVDFQRISATDKITMSVPFHFMGEEEAPGVKTEGGIVSHQLTEISINCLPSDLPEYLSIDVSGMSLNDTIHLSEVTLPDGVEFSTHPEGESDHPVVSVMMPRVSVDEEGDEVEDEDEDEHEAERTGEPEAEED